MHQVYDPAFADEVPYNIAMVELEEGVRMTTNVVGCANEELADRDAARGHVRAAERARRLAEIQAGGLISSRCR